MFTLTATLNLIPCLRTKMPHHPHRLIHALVISFSVLAYILNRYFFCHALAFVYIINLFGMGITVVNMFLNTFLIPNEKKMIKNLLVTCLLDNQAFNVYLIIASQSK